MYHTPSQFLSNQIVGFQFKNNMCSRVDPDKLAFQKQSADLDLYRYQIRICHADVVVLLCVYLYMSASREIPPYSTYKHV